ncbi:GDNF family receptor alpha-3 [Bufo gargarizans]|uniref:GDNF family receptor alpha-3 n=1 Tax=Bufo gargarizans TaxID=30331 RepID=UPI001CF0DE7E|nr:GDNF family receptor alpha-3 [Bufo gargarizans]
MRCLGVILLLVDAAFTLSMNSPELIDCVSAEELCRNDPLCNSTYQVLKNCSRADTSACQEAAELISKTPIIHCKCHHRMRKEEHCLDVYWTVHPDYKADLTGYLVSSESPYSDESETKEERKQNPFFDSEPDLSDASNACIHEANICSSIEKCETLKTEYVMHCSSIKAEGSCDRRKCHNHLRNFIKKIPMEFTKRLLFCPCDQDKSCGDRRRQIIVPKCSFEEKEKKNCLSLYDSCMSDTLCRSRLLDYKKQCRLFEKNREGCSPGQYDPCIKSYIRMIGTSVTPNFINNSSMDTSLWCTCEGSANKLEECDAFLGMFTSNKCLQKAISPDLNQSLPMTLNDDQKSPTDGKSDTDLAVLAEKNQKTPTSHSLPGAAAPSFTLLMWLLIVVSFM